MAKSNSKPRSKPRSPAKTEKPPDPNELTMFPHQLRAGAVITDEHGDEWELAGPPTKIVGSPDYVATLRRVGRPAETREGRWRAHERVKVRRAP
jgi:hypothetical protein